MTCMSERLREFMITSINNIGIHNHTYIIYECDLVFSSIFHKRNKIKNNIVFNV